MGSPVIKERFLPGLRMSDRRAQSPAVHPGPGFFIGHRLPPFVARRRQRVTLGDSERESLRPDLDDFRNGRSMTSDDDRLPSLYEFEQL